MIGCHLLYLMISADVSSFLEAWKRRLPGSAGCDEDALTCLARAILSTPGWSGAEGARLVVRRHPEPRLAVLGRLPAEMEEWLTVSFGRLPEIAGRLVYLDDRTVRDQVAELSRKLLGELAGDLPAATFSPVVRGGFIVLGQLAYQMGLGPRQLQGEAAPGGVRVFVDDCIISGARAREIIERYRGDRIVFGVLWAHPGLIHRIEEEEKGRVRVVAAQHLTDLAPEIHGSGYEEWLGRWRDRSDSGAYWHGITEHIAFPWSEPDVGIWSDMLGKTVLAFRVTPPELCLKNRVTFEGHARLLQVQPEASGPLRPADDILFADVDETIYIAATATARSLKLTSSAADFWRALVRRGSRQGMVEDISRLYDVDALALRADVEAFIAQLIEQGVLTMMRTRIIRSLAR